MSDTHDERGGDECVARANRQVDKCQQRGRAAVADVESLRNDVETLAELLAAETASPTTPRRCSPATRTPPGTCWNPSTTKPRYAVAELIRIVWAWTGIALVGTGLWAIIVGCIKASAQRKAAGR